MHIKARTVFKFLGIYQEITDIYKVLFMKRRSNTIAIEHSSSNYMWQGWSACPILWSTSPGIQNYWSFWDLIWWYIRQSSPNSHMVVFILTCWGRSLMKTNNDNGPSAVLWVDFCGGGGGALYCNPYVMVAQEGLNPGVDGACDAVVK